MNPPAVAKAEFKELAAKIYGDRYWRSASYVIGQDGSYRFRYGPVWDTTQETVVTYSGLADMARTLIRDANTESQRKEARAWKARWRGYMERE